MLDPENVGLFREDEANIEEAGEIVEIKNEKGQIVLEKNISKHFL